MKITATTFWIFFKKDKCLKFIVNTLTKIQSSKHLLEIYFKMDVAVLYIISGERISQLFSLAYSSFGLTSYFCIDRKASSFGSSPRH